jgi:hypothetical protein
MVPSRSWFDKLTMNPLTPDFVIASLKAGEGDVGIAD